MSYIRQHHEHGYYFWNGHLDVELMAISNLLHFSCVKETTAVAISSEHGSENFLLSSRAIEIWTAALQLVATGYVITIIPLQSEVSARSRGTPANQPANFGPAHSAPGQNAFSAQRQTVPD